MNDEDNWVLYEKTGNVAKITLNRPEQLNKLTAGMNKRIMEAMDDYQADDALRVLIITGVGKGFSTGEDVGELSEAQRTRKPEIPTRANPIPCHMVEHIQKPIIASINGICAGMGYCIALACDLKIASENAKFVHVYLRRGLVPSGELWYLPRYMGMANALYHLFTADEIDAREAARWGMVSKVVPPERLEPETLDLASIVASQPPLVLRFAKKLAREGLHKNYLDTMEAVNAARAITRYSGEPEEGIKAFREKRKPVFRPFHEDEK